MAAVGTAPLPWCHFDTPPLVDIAADQLGLQWNIAGCPIHAQNHCSAPLIFGAGNSPSMDFFTQLGIEFLLFYHSITHQFGKV